MEDEPTYTPACKSNSPGALKWPVNSELCYEFWCDNGGDCSTCIAICPYTKRSFSEVPYSPKAFWADSNNSETR